MRRGERYRSRGEYGAGVARKAGGSGLVKRGSPFSRRGEHERGGAGEMKLNGSRLSLPFLGLKEGTVSSTVKTSPVNSPGVIRRWSKGRWKGSVV